MLSNPVSLWCWSLSMASSPVLSKSRNKLFKWNPCFMASSVGKIILNWPLPSHPCPSESRRTMFPISQGFSSPHQLRPSSLTCLPPPTPTDKPIAQRCHGMLAPLLFPSSYPMMNQKKLWFRRKTFSPFFFSSSKVLCPLDSSPIKQYWTTTENQLSGKFCFCFKASLV